MRSFIHKTIFKAIKIIFHILERLWHWIESLREPLSIFWDIHRYDIFCLWFRKLNWLSRINCIDLGFNIYWHVYGIYRIISVSLSDNISTNWLFLCNCQSFWFNCSRSGNKWTWVWSWHCGCDNNCFYYAIIAIMNFRFFGIYSFISNWRTENHWVDSTCLQIQKTVICFWKLVL